MSQLRLLSKQYSKTMSALILLCPMMLLASCGSTKEVLIPVQPVPIPAQLTADCPQPDVPEHMDWKDMPQLLVDAMNSIAKCNLDKKAIREIEQQRNAPNIGAKRE
ncbi:Rz1-like lysis system protein LysC [Providencia sp. PROV150]|uniref:Rz1-like lysis system protein LysC n=1 Tax=Providencia sp. PROV150 TaxID=2949860 RepID=UPI0023491F31|nr:Rz1 lytic protein [Providencia sp. PROV150]